MYFELRYSIELIRCRNQIVPAAQQASYRQRQSARSQGLPCLAAELPTELDRMLCVCFGDGIPRIARLHRIAGEQAEGRLSAHSRVLAFIHKPPVAQDIRNESVALGQSARHLSR